ncbi:MAG: 1,4-dihydroxy-2-naphthoate polyprenyltransferase [Bacteroidota bacterium]|nr:1,4-dihydroxy-2-naphthoate polyprenyltransferase [Bacteroidota bacterium]
MRLGNWVTAIRPKTLPASAVPVLVGSAVAGSEGAFSALPASVAFVCALAIQVGTNLANDYFDFMKGVDTPDRLGPIRVTQSGLIPPRTVRNAMIGVLGGTFLLGLTLVYIAGWPILILGMLSLVCAVAYTAGPFPLAYIGLGDLFVFLFFGVGAVTGTHYVQALRFSHDALAASLPIGAISTAILVVNNYRDIDTDRKTGKRTLAVRIGREATRVEFTVLLSVAFAVPVVQAAYSGVLFFLLPLVSIPLAVRIVRIVLTRTDGPSLNRVLAATGGFLVVFGVLYSAAFLLR